MCILSPKDLYSCESINERAEIKCPFLENSFHLLQAERVLSYSEMTKKIRKKATGRDIVSRQKLQDCIFSVAGDPGIKVVDFLGERKNVSEFIIADKLKLDMQTIRNTLYKLHTHNVATYIRKKDRQKGWYISYWTFNKRRVKELIGNLKKIRLEQLRDRLKKEEENKNLFFICTKACARLDFDQATEFEFKCPECGGLLHQQENSRTIEHLRSQIKDLEASS